jgi:large subunit ribosomal protein L33
VGSRLAGAGIGRERPSDAPRPGPELWSCTNADAPFPLTLQSFYTMQEQVTLECTEAKKEGKPASRYLTFRNKKTVTERIEKKKYNPFLKRHTLHKEIK